ncbi:hypothetical protein QQ054_25845 [Oscillatoria amoena NRMC-F 0135]|nr:hypothetical protein [Oscillatoria amoena NRMC-F 0135]
MRKVCYLFIFLSSTFQCSEFEPINGIPFRQYADSVIDFSSEWNPSPGNWSSSRALGKEDVYKAGDKESSYGYGDNVNAWSPATEDGQREYLVFGFDTVQTIKIIEVYETWYPGAIDTVYIRSAETQRWEIVYSKPALTNLPDSARIFKLFLPLETTYLVDAIRLAINSPEVEGWNEIDAVAITGQRRKNED